MIRNKKDIVQHIKIIADEEYKKFQSSLCPNTNNIIGVRVPILRKYVKELCDADWEKTYKNIGNEFYEEILLKGLILGIVNMGIEERLKYLEEFIPNINNWAICDITCMGLKWIRTERARVYKFLKKYLISNKEFELRFAIVIILNYYIEENYITEVFNIIDNIEYKEYYYVQMAIAWLISVTYIKFPDKTIKYLKNSKLDKAIYNKAIQKIIESNRVSKLEKNKIKKMRK